jgi:hypothetical protein
MFGVETPEIHYKTLKLNTEEVTGSLQLVYPHSDAPKMFTEYSKLNQESLEYFARNHVLSWLTANNNVHPGQFLHVYNENGEVRILRIDNCVQWFLMKTDSLNIDYRTPVLLAMPEVGYTRFWRAFLQKNKNKAPSYFYNKLYIDSPELFKIHLLIKSGLEKNSFNLDLAKIYQWASFIASFPDTEYVKFFEEGIKNNLVWFKNNGPLLGEVSLSDLMNDIEPSEFVPLLLKRKNALNEDLKKFYEHLISVKQLKVEFVANKNFDKIEKEILKTFDQSDMQKKKLLDQLVAMPKIEQKEIAAPISLKTYYNFIETITVNFDDERLRLEVITKTIKFLEKNKRNLKNSNELLAISTVIGNLNDLNNFLKENHPSKYFLRENILMNGNAFFTPDYVKNVLMRPKPDKRF